MKNDILRELCESFAIQSLHEKGLPCDTALVRSFEHQIGMKLPDSYTTFVQHINGGRYYSPLVEFEPQGFELAAFQFFGLHDGPCGKEDSLTWNHDVHDGRLPDNSVAIGDIAGSNLVILDTKSGQLFEWYRDMELSTTRDEGVRLLADSFMSFLHGVQNSSATKAKSYSIEGAEPFQSIEVHDPNCISIIENSKSDVSEVLAVACEYGNYAVVKFLLDSGADGTRTSHRDTRSPIELAYDYGYGDIVLLLLENGASRKPLRKCTKRVEIDQYITEFDSGLRKSFRACG